MSLADDLRARINAQIENAITGSVGAVRELPVVGFTLMTVTERNTLYKCDTCHGAVVAEHRADHATWHLSLTRDLLLPLMMEHYVSRVDSTGAEPIGS